MEIMEGAVSSATIRNELVALDKMGYLEQPHTSAGRIPTVSGYRFYIDNLMHSRDLTPVERGLVDSRIASLKAGSLDEFVYKACESLSDMTGCAVAASAPDIGASVKRVEYFPMTPGSGIVAVLLSSGLIKSRISSTEEPVSSAMLYRFLQVVNAQLTGKKPADIGPWDYSIVAQATGSYARLFTPVMEAVHELLSETNRTETFLCGQRHLVDTVGPERSGDVIRYLADGEKLSDLLKKTGEETGVLMGGETGEELLTPVSMVLAPYFHQGDKAGCIGVIVSRRAEYSRLLPLTDYFARRLSAAMDFSRCV